MKELERNVTERIKHMRDFPKSIAERERTELERDGAHGKHETPSKKYGGT